MSEDTGGSAVAALRLIVEGTAGATGDAYLSSLVRCLAGALDARCSFIGELNADRTMVRAQAFWLDGKLVDGVCYAVQGTPCERILDGDVVAFPRDVCNLFPEHRAELEAIGAESYLAIPLNDTAGCVVGHLAVIDERARDWHELDLGILRVFAARATAEMHRCDYERELESARAAAEAASRAKTQFLASMSHELRTPMNGILGYAQLLERDPALNAQQRGYVVSIERCGEQLLRLINEVLDIAKIDAGGQELAEHAVSGRIDFDGTLGRGNGRRVETTLPTIAAASLSPPEPPSLPSVQELQELLALARSGDVAALASALDRIEQSVPGCAQFVATLREMMREFDMRRIRDYLTPRSVAEQ